MSLHAHYETVQQKHSKLEAQIAQEWVRPSPDLVAIQTLKKQKLLLKEELERIRHEEERQAAA